MGLVCVATAAVCVLLSQVEITTTDRPTFQAKLLGLSPTSAEVSVDGKPMEIPLGKLRQIALRSYSANQRSFPANQLGSAAQVARLVDGSQFAYTSFAIENGSAQFSLADGTQLQTPSKNLFYVQLQALNDQQATQWQAITQSRLSGDALVLIRSEEALENLEGVILGISAESVSFDFGGQKIEAPRPKLAGMRFFAGDGAKQAGNLAAIVYDTHGGSWMSSAVQVPRDGTSASMTLLCGATVTLPLTELSRIDYSSGSMLFLAELEPLQSASIKRIDVGLAIAGAEKLFGAQLKDLRQPGGSSLGPSLEFVGSGSAVYRVPAGYARLVGAVELRPTGSRYTPCKVSVQLESNTLWQERLAETGKPISFDLPIQADGRLRIEVDAESKVPVGDVVLWHDIRFVK